MLKTESNIFFNIPDESTEVALHRAKILTVKENIYTAELEEEGLAIAADSEIDIYYELDRQFVRHPAHVGALISTEPRIVVEFETLGEPVNAENRQALRISSVGTDLTATFGSEKNCQVIDVSPTGFAVYATKHHEINTAVEVTLHFEGEDFQGTVCIKAAIPRKSEIRYGVFCLDDQKSGNSLLNGLGKITMAIQRKQLSRVTRDE